MELSQHTKNILGLQLPTDPRWVDLASISIEAILTDHAYCEMKAALTCMSYIQRYPQNSLMVESLAPIVTEEWGHFRMVLAELKKRDLPLGKQRRDEYANRLMDFQKKGGHPDDRFLDQMLTMALIEARSCERFKRLSQNIEDPKLAKFYKDLMISEAGHYTTFLGFARKYTEKVDVDKRWKEWLAYEIGVMKDLEISGERIH